jgi:hypothetical protein
MASHRKLPQTCGWSPLSRDLRKRDAGTQTESGVCTENLNPNIMVMKPAEDSV